MAFTRGQLIGSGWVPPDGALLASRPVLHFWLSPERTTNVTATPPAAIGGYVANFAEARWYAQVWPASVTFPVQKASWAVTGGLKHRLMQDTARVYLEDVTTTPTQLLEIT